MALAYLITFTTYGARLHGSDEGSVDDQHNVYDTRWPKRIADANVGRKQG